MGAHVASKTSFGLGCRFAAGPGELKVEKILGNGSGNKRRQRRQGGQEGGEVILYSLKDEGRGRCGCVMAVFAPSVAECRAVADAFCQGRPQPGVVDGGPSLV